MSDLLNQASLVMIPSGYKEDTVYSVVPSDGSGDLSFTRASNGTRVNSAGLVEVCPWNLVQQSETFDNGYWSKQNGTITTNAITAPNGTTTGDLFTITNNSGGVEKTIVSSGTSFTFIPNTQYTFSCYFKKGSIDYNFRMLMYDGSTVTNSGTINLTTPSSSTVSYEDVGNGWYRFYHTFTSSASASSGYFYAVNYDYSTTITSGTNVYLWGAQVVQGATAKPYFPTTDRLNVPRLTYQNGGGGCPSLLLEKQSTNYITYSEQFDNAAWTKNGVSLTANDTTSPDGTQNADKLTTNDPSGSVYRIYETAVIPSDSVCSVSCYFKYDNWQYAFIVADNYSGIGKLVVFDLINGTNTFVSSGYTATISSVGNGWYRCTMTGEMGITAYCQFGLAPTSTTYNNISIANGKNLYVWGTQREVSSYATSYIGPTTSSSATRVADACYKTGISSLIGQTEGTMFLDVSGPSKTGDARYMTLSNGSTSNRIVIYSTTLTSIGVYLENPSGGGALGCNTVNGRMKIAFTYKNNDLRLYLNGVLKDAAISFTSSFTLNSVTIGTYEDYQVYNSLDQSINEAIIFPTALTNAEAIALTTI